MKVIRIKYRNWRSELEQSLLSNDSTPHGVASVVHYQLVQWEKGEGGKRMVRADS